MFWNNIINTLWVVLKSTRLCAYPSFCQSSVHYRLISMNYVKPLKSVRITKSANFSPLHIHIKLIQVEATRQTDTCSKLSIKNCTKLHKVIAMLSLFKLNNKNTRATPIDDILVSLLLTFNKFVSCFYLQFLTGIYLIW